MAGSGGGMRDTALGHRLLTIDLKMVIAASFASTGVMFESSYRLLQQFSVLSPVYCKLHHPWQCIFVWFHIHNEHS
jgi:hypothetical protein